jgi:hypothetical protein
MRKRSLAVVVAALGLAVTAVAPTVSAADPFNATVAGQRAFTPLVNLAPSSTLTVDAVNLPAGVGLYALHCKTPADPRQAPTVCDQSTGAAAYLPADAVARATVQIPVRVNGEFFGTNPNPTAGVITGESVDCRVPTGNPRTTTCSLYLLGAGRDSANPAYLRVWPTAFSPVRADRRADAATVTLAGTVVTPGTAPVLRVSAPQRFSVTLASGLTPSLTADNCSVAGGRITALKAEGTCTVTITSTGGKNVKPLVTTQAFRLRP